MKFKEGQSVLIKNPRTLVGVVVRERPGDYGLPEDERRIIVHIEARDFIFQPDDLVALDEPKLTPFSSEWTKEFSRFLDAGYRLVANAEDSAARDEFVEAGEKIGWVGSLKSEKP